MRRRDNQIKLELLPFHGGQQWAYNQFTKRTLVRAGRRFGKTTMLENIAADWAIRGLKVGWFAPSYKLLTPSYKNIYKILSPIKKAASKIDGIIETITKGQTEFWTLTDEDAGRSRNYDLVIVDEAGLMKKGLREVWEQAIRPTLLDRGGHAVMAGTPKGIDEENFFYVAATDKSLGWHEIHTPTMANPTLDQESVAKLKEENPPLVYRQEFLAEFVDWSGETFFPLDKMMKDGKPVIYPRRCDLVFATMDTAVKSGKEHDGTAIVYWAYDSHGIEGHKLTVLDWDIVQIDGALLETWMPVIFQHMQQLRIACNTRFDAVTCHIEDKAAGSILLQQGMRRGLDVRSIDSKLTSFGKDERAISVSGYYHRGEVKISQYAYDKITNYKTITRNHFLTQVLGFKVGIDNGADDLTDCFTYGIAIALGNGDGY